MFNFFRKRPKVFLIGGFFINPNYGDILQAKTWVDYYSSHNYEIYYIYSSNVAKTDIFKSYLGNLHYISDKKILDESINFKGNLVHFYGGGYLNTLWGTEFLNIIKILSANNKIIFTGEQTDVNWTNNYNKEILNKNNINWISFRDSQSAINLSKNPTILDDSLLYFNKLKSSNKEFKISNKKTILLSINLSNYSLKNFISKDNFNIEDKRETNLNYLSSFINKIPSDYDIKILQNFYFNSEDIIEGESLIKLLNTTREIEIVSAFDLEYMRFNNAIGISSTFHSAILLRYLLDLQIMYIAENDYYKQKANGLIEMGLLDKSNLFDEYKKLSNINLKDKISHQPDYTNENNIINNKVSKVLNDLENTLKHD